MADDEFAGAGDCIGAVAGFDFIIPENIEGFLAGATVGEAPFSSGRALPLVSVNAALLHDIRLCVVGSLQ